MFKSRSSKQELLDADSITAKHLHQNLKELHVINRNLGGYRVSINAIKPLLKNGSVLVDIGCGGGDTLKTLHKKFSSLNLKLYGIDLKKECIEYCEKNPVNGIDFICDDFMNVTRHIPTVDILHASLFTHHLNEKQIVDLIQFTLKNKSILVVNDLERNPIAYYAILFLTKVFSKSYLVKNDAPLSVLRGFKKKEWDAIIQLAGAKKYTVKNKWAFRHEVIIYE